MKMLTLAAAGVAALALVACTDTNPEETATAAAMPDTSTTESPAPSAGATGVAGPDAANSGSAETDENLPPVNLPAVSN